MPHASSKMVHVSYSSSTTTQCCVRVAILNADTTRPNTYAHMGTFGDILHNVLTAAAGRVAPHVRLKHTVFDVVKGEYPASAADFDAFIITASAASAMDEAAWIRELEGYVVLVHEGYPEAKLFGSCFGHHIICQALLKQHGLRVEKNRRGWEIGVSRVHFSDDFRKAVRALEQSGRRGRLPSPEAEVEGGNGGEVTSMRLQFVHEDEVVMVAGAASSCALPSAWVMVGSTNHCNIQGIYQAGRVMTLQGHFELDKFEKGETRRIFGADDEEAHDDAVQDDDGERMAELVLRFLTVETREWQPRQETSMLLTPRSSLEI